MAAACSTRASSHVSHCLSTLIPAIQSLFCFSHCPQVVIRIVSTLVGASLGLGAMHHPSLAGSPWGLGALLVGLAALLAPLAALTQLKLMVVLGLLTLNSTVLCQYVGCCSATGSLGYYLGRVVSISGGAAFAMLLNRLLWPWSRNSWALEQMADALGLAVEAVAGMYAREHGYMAALAAAAAAEAEGGDGSAHGGSKGATSSSSRHDQGLHVAVAMPVPAAGRTGVAAAPVQADMKQQLAQIQARLLPVQASLQRDTWLRWRSGVLAVPPVVHLMLAGCLQLLDALSALSVTLERPFLPADHLQQPQQQQQQNGGSAQCLSAAAGLAAALPGDRALALGLLRYEDLAAPLHGNIMHLLGELRCLVQAVQQAVRQRGSLAVRQELQAKVWQQHGPPACSDSAAGRHALHC